jgi:aspartate/methionine/tyrosine aminotransferase
MRNLKQWLAGERAEILDRRAAIEEGFARLDGWRLLGCGAYFAYAEHPARRGLGRAGAAAGAEAGILLLPGTMFRPAGDAAGARELRIAFANIDRAGIAELFTRLGKLGL